MEIRKYHNIRLTLKIMENLTHFINWSYSLFVLATMRILRIRELVE